MRRVAVSFLIFSASLRADSLNSRLAHLCGSMDEHLRTYLFTEGDLDLLEGDVKSPLVARKGTHLSHQSSFCRVAHSP